MKALNLRYTPPRICTVHSRAHTLVAYDPDCQGGGLCLGGVLPSAGVATPMGALHVHVKGSPLDVIEEMARQLSFDPVLCPQLVIVAEKPIKRKHQRAKHNAVEKLNEMLRCFKRYIKPAVWVNVAPEQYKRNVPKAIHHARAWAALTNAEQHHPELMVLNPDGDSYQHDTSDAIALWLWATGRLGTGGRP